MANKKPAPRPVPKAKVAQAPPAPPVTPVFPFSFSIKLIIVALLSFVLYVDTLGNKYCLDDGIVIEKNRYVQQGFSGIGDIMTTDAYDSYYKEMNAGQQLSGGRYRPLSEVIFAIEHAAFAQSGGGPEKVRDGLQPIERFISRDNDDTTIAGIRHFFSVICFVLCVMVIFYFLSKYLFKKFKYGEDMAFLATILFAIHPIHTEVVANVKSLDEILSILFICLTFIFSLRFLDKNQPIDIIFGVVTFFLALLAKEYAVIMVFMIPMMFYILRKKTFVQNLMPCLYFWGIFIIYLFIRGHAVGFNGHVYTNEILDNPYLLASKTQKLGTELFVLFKYLWLLIVPYPLVSDYSYCQIPYQDLFSLPVIGTVILYGGIVGLGIWLFVKRNPLSFAVAFYLFNLAIVSNLFMDIGATMGERLIFHSSLGFVCLVAYGAFEAIKKMQLEQKRAVVFIFTSIVVIACGYETMARNLDWRSDVTLFTHDVTIGTNSIMLNGNAGARYIELAQETKDSIRKKHKLDTAIIYLRKSIYLHKKSAYVSSYLNLGDAYFEQQMPDSAEVYWKIVRKNYPSYPQLSNYFFLLGRQYMSLGSKMGGQRNYAGATKEMYKAINVDPNDAELWYNLGGAYFTWGKYDSAYYAWNRTLQINPNHAQAKQGLSALVPVKKKKD